MASPIIKKLIFSVIPVLGLLLGLELWAHHQLDGALLERAGPLGWTALPNLDNHVVQPVGQTPFVVSTNADGLRTPHTRERTAPGQRVLIFGESTIFGWGNGEDEHLAPLVERILGDRAHVVNAGQPGYSSEMVRGFAEAVVPAYKPDVVVLFQPWNDRTPWSHTDRESIPQHPATLRQRGLFSSLAIVRLLRDQRLRSPPEAPNEVPELFAMSRPKDAVDGSITRVPDAERIENILALRDLSEAHGAVFLTAQLGINHARPRDGSEVAAYIVSLQTLADQEGYAHIDLTDALVGNEREDVMQATSKFHFTPYANRLFAVRIANGLLPHLDGSLTATN